MSPTQGDHPRRIRTEAAAKHLGLSVSTLTHDRIYRGLGIPFLKLGKTVVYDTAALDQWMACRQVVPELPVTRRKAGKRVPHQAAA